jgi:hypothetical protein
VLPLGNDVIELGALGDETKKFFTNHPPVGFADVEVGWQFALNETMASSKHSASPMIAIIYGWRRFDGGVSPSTDLSLQTIL